MAGSVSLFVYPAVSWGVQVAYIVNSSGIIRGSYFIEQLGSDSSDRFKAALLNAVCDYYRENDERQPSEVLIYIQITKEDDATKVHNQATKRCLRA